MFELPAQHPPSTEANSFEKIELAAHQDQAPLMAQFGIMHLQFLLGNKVCTAHH
jgi:hypothetical protein